jgi:hypothetical protein
MYILLKELTQRQKLRMYKCLIVSKYKHISEEKSTSVIEGGSHSMKPEAIHLSFTELWNSRTVRETNSVATWSHPDLSETATLWQNNGVEMGSHLRANPQYMHHTQFVNLKHYNLMPNSKQNW